MSKWNNVIVVLFSLFWCSCTEKDHDVLPIETTPSTASTNHETSKQEFGEPPVFDYYNSDDVMNWQGGCLIVTLKALPSENSIAIKGLTSYSDIPLNGRDFPLWFGDKALDTTQYWKDAGYSEFPNSLDFEFHYEWYSVATEKHIGRDWGLMKIKVAPNPYNRSRLFVVWLQNQMSQFALIAQEKNPNGLDVPVNDYSYYVPSNNNK